MQVPLCSPGRPFRVDQPAQTGADGGGFGHVHGGVGYQRGIGCKPLGVRGDELRDGLSAHFLLALDEELDIHGKLSVGLPQALQRLDVRQHLALVVGGPASVDLPAHDSGIKRVGVPFVDRVDRLHVVVSVEQDRRLAGRMAPFPIDERVPPAFNDLDGVESALNQLALRIVRRPANVRTVLRKRADAGDSQEAEEFILIALAISGDAFGEGRHLIQGCWHARRIATGRPDPNWGSGPLPDQFGAP